MDQDPWDIGILSHVGIVHKMQTVNDLDEVTPDSVDGHLFPRRLQTLQLFLQITTFTKLSKAASDGTRCMLRDSTDLHEDESFLVTQADPRVDHLAEVLVLHYAVVKPIEKTTQSGLSVKDANAAYTSSEAAVKSFLSSRWMDLRA